MANGTSISDRTGEILARELPLQEKLSLLSKAIFDHFGMRTQFCRIFGKRWAYFCGIDDDAVIPATRIEICGNWGVIADRVPGSLPEWNPVIQALASYLENISVSD